MTEVEAGFLAARLLCVSALVFLAPGLALLSVWRVPAEWPERVVLAFSLSYAWIFILSAVVPLVGSTVDHAALATACLVIGSTAVAAWRRTRHDTPAGTGRPGAATLVLVAVVIAGGVAGWVVEPPFTGEEALDLTSLSRFADGGPITFDNTSILPDTRPVYLFQPYQLALGAIARWSGTDPLVAFVKFRAFLAPLCLLCLYGLLRRLTRSRADALAAFMAVVLFVALEIETWESNSLFPFVRRGGFCAAALVPALLMLCVIATRRAQEGGERVLRRVALGVAPLMLVASMSTHPMEMFPVLIFAGAAAAAIIVGLDPGGDRKQALVLMLALGTAVGAYLAVHSRSVSYVAEHERYSRRDLRARLGQLVTDPREAIAGPSGRGDLLVGSTPLTTAAVLGIPALGLAVLGAPAATAVLALATVPLVLVYAAPAGYVALQLLTSPGTIGDTTVYFMLMGALGVALSLVALAHGVLQAAASRPQRFSRVVTGLLALSLAVIAGRAAVEWLANVASIRPGLFLVVQTALAAAVVAIAAVRPRPILGTTSSGGGVVLLTACLAVPLAVPGLAFGGVFTRGSNASVFTRFASAASHPSVLDWPAYYEELAETIQPRLPVPRAVVDQLRRRLPPRRILLAPPSYSCALVVLVDAYCVNPASIYGHYFQPAARYLAEYVGRENKDAPEHPFFNARPSLAETEDRLLTDYRVSYLLADPEHAAAIALKLQHVTVGATLEMDLDGYRLYRIGGS